MSTTRDSSSAKRRAYQEKAAAEMRALSARVDELLARAEAHKAAGKIELYKRLEKLSAQRDSVRERLDELRETSSDVWDEVRSGFERAIYELSTAFHSAVDRVRDEDGGGAMPTPSTQSASDSNMSSGA